MIAMVSELSVMSCADIRMNKEKDKGVVTFMTVPAPNPSHLHHHHPSHYIILYYTVKNRDLPHTYLPTYWVLQTEYIDYFYTNDNEPVV